MRLACLIIVSVLLCSGCAYRRHTTLLNPLPAGSAANEEAPSDVYSVRVVRGEVPPRKISGLPWDDDKTGPDTFVRLYVGDRMVWESEVIENQTRPEWNVTLPRNVRIPSNSRFRVELLDYDTAVSADPIGHLQQTGLPPTALPGALARLYLEGGSMLAIQVDEPVAQRGVGLTVEIRPDHLRVLKVEPYSPAARAGIRSGDRITAIGPERVSSMSDDDAASALSLAADRRQKLAVADPEGHDERKVTLESSYIWLVM